MAALKFFLRKFVYPLITGTGAERLLSRSRPHASLILCYHGVSHHPNRINNRHMPVAQFKKEMQYLQSKFEIVALDELFRRRREGIAPTQKTIAITFDDGYLNNYTVAWPILQAMQIPATYYITTQCLTTPGYLLWPDIFDALRLGDPSREYVFNQTAFVFRDGVLATKEGNIAIYDYVKSMGRERNALLEEFSKQYAIPSLIQTLHPELYAFMKEDQLREMASSPFVQIGSHTHNHYNLGQVDPALAEEELKHSKDVLEKLLGKPVTSIAYPDGNYNTEVKDISARIGYTDQLAVSYKEASDPQDPRILSRFSVSNTSTFEGNMIQLHAQFSRAGF